MSDSQSRLTYLQVHWFFFFFLFKSAVNSSFLHPEFLSGSLFLHWYFCLVRHSLEFSFSSLGLVSCSWNTFMTPDLSHCLVVRPCLGFLRDSFCWLLVFLRIGHTHLFLCMVLNFVLSTRRFKEYHEATLEIRFLYRSRICYCYLLLFVCSVTFISKLILQNLCSAYWSANDWTEDSLSACDQQLSQPSQGALCVAGHIFSTRAADSSSLAFISCFHRESVLARRESSVPPQLFPVRAHSLDISEALWTFLSLLNFLICPPQAAMILNNYLCFIFPPTNAPSEKAVCTRWAPTQVRYRVLRVGPSRERMGQLMTIL